MLYRFLEFGKCVEITGFRHVDFAQAEAYLKTCRKQTNHTELQFFDADLIATAEHLYFAVLNALQAFRAQTNIAKSVAVEMMLYASANRQIQRAIEHIGIKPTSRNVAVVIVGDDANAVAAQLGALLECLGCVPDDSVLELNADKQQKIQAAFEISPIELETVKGSSEEVLAALVIERMALLSTQV